MSKRDRRCHFQVAISPHRGCETLARFRDYLGIIQSSLFNQQFVMSCLQSHPCQLSDFPLRRLRMHCHCDPVVLCRSCRFSRPKSRVFFQEILAFSGARYTRDHRRRNDQPFGSHFNSHCLFSDSTPFVSECNRPKSGTLSSISGCRINFRSYQWPRRFLLASLIYLVHPRLFLMPIAPYDPIQPDKSYFLFLLPTCHQNARCRPPSACSHCLSLGLQIVSKFGRFL